MTNTRLITDLSAFVPLCHDVIQVTSFSGAHTADGKPVLNMATQRSYRCYIQNNERTSWNDYSATDGMPYVAFVLSIPIGQGDALAIHKTEQMSVTTSSYVPTPTIRRIGTIKSYQDQFGNLHNMAITFE